LRWSQRLTTLENRDAGLFGRAPWNRCGAALLALGMSTCAEPAPPPRALELRQIRPESRAGVFLNEHLVMHFSAPLAPQSVHAGSARVVSAAGQSARGRWVVHRDRLEFVPAPVLAPDRADGGYLPGTEYWVERAGFPRADALRSEDGAPLASGVRWRFQTVDPATARGAPVFEDSSPTLAAPLILRTPVIRPFDVIRLSCEEPLDPATVRSSDFELLPHRNIEPLRRTRGEAIPLVARLVQNEERQPYRSEAAVLTLVPVVSRDRRLVAGSYKISVSRDLVLRDMGGHVPLVLNANRRPDQLFVRVELGARTGDGRMQRHVESFLDPTQGSDDPYGGADGTARWSNSGRVDVGFPAAAGTGSDGEVLAEARLWCVDVHATRFEVPADASAQLDAPEGPVVVRSQTQLAIAGELSRGSLAWRPSVEESERAACEFDAWLLASRSHAAPSSFEAALREVQRDGMSVTVLIAGGDLIVSGALRSDHPLMLIAGGRIRIGHEQSLRAPRVAFADSGTHELAYVRLGDGAAVRAERADFAWSLDPPRSNPLRVPLRLVCLSRSLPRGTDRAARWLPEPLIQAHTGSGNVRVGFLGQRSSTDGRPARDVVVDDPAALVDCATMRLMIELEVLPGEVWDPPWVDDVTVEYELAQPGGGG
jgi:hypothetical protein